MTEFDDSLQSLASEMLLVMYETDGIGLAAPQVGVNKRLMVFNDEGNPTKPEHERVMVNPTIKEKSTEMYDSEEGCLSFPQIYGKVQRHKWIDVEYQTLDGTKVTVRLDGNPGRVFQHEYDHLDKV